MAALSGQRLTPSRLAAAIQRRWYDDRPSAALRPLAALHGAVVAGRRLAYRRGWFTSWRVDRPVLIVGNVCVGGSGKTPLTLAIIERAQRLGLKPGVVSRGYGGRAEAWPLVVRPDTPAAEAGDEPVLIARRTGVPVVVDPDRVRAARRLIEWADVSLVIADDGLQHYRLARDAEIVVVDAQRGHGNGSLLPAGPLREPVARAQAVDLVCVHGAGRDFWLMPGAARNLRDDEQRELSAFGRVHALAGIGNPARFFAMLREAGASVIEHAAPDHYRYREADLEFDGDYPLLMTEKDAVKCAGFARGDLWSVPVETVLSADCAARIDGLLARLAEEAS